MTRTREPWRRALHVLGSGVAWILFLWAWFAIFIRPLDEASWLTFLLILLYGAAMVLVNFLWVRYNIHLYKTKTKRKRTPELSFDRTLDVRGRRLVAPPWARVQQAQVVTIEMQDEPPRKVYEIVSEPDVRGDA